MPLGTYDSLMGFGFPGEQAAILGANTQLALQGVGTAQTGAAVLLSRSVELIPVTNQTAYIMPSTIGINEPVFLFNNAASAVTALVFCPSGGTMSGSSNGSISVAQDKGAIVWQYKKGFWCGIVSA
jgi:hypothetical protein